MLEEKGPLRAVVKVSGWIDDGGTKNLVKYLVRVHAFAGRKVRLEIEERPFDRTITPRRRRAMLE